MRQKAYFFLVSLLLLGGRANTQTVQQSLVFADSLFTSGETVAALPVYQRVAYFLRPEVDANILHRIADCMVATGDIEKALAYYDHSYFAQTNDSIKREIVLQKSACYLRTQNYKYALMELLSLENSADSEFEHRKNFYLGMVWFGMEDFEKAEGYFEKATDNALDKEKISVMFSAKRQFYKPDPKRASWLSVFLPGAGQIYSGETAAGINSLLLTGFFLGFGFYLVTVTSPLDAIVTALPWFQRYYQGGFQRAAELAKNKRAENRNRVFNEVVSVITPDK